MLPQPSPESSLWAPAPWEYFTSAGPHPALRLLRRELVLDDLDDDALDLDLRQVRLAFAAQQVQCGQLDAQLLDPVRKRLAVLHFREPVADRLRHVRVLRVEIGRGLL